MHYSLRLESKNEFVRLCEHAKLPVSNRILNNKHELEFYKLFKIKFI